MNQVPPPGAKAGRFELFDPGNNTPLLHAVITGAGVADRSGTPEYRQEREHWFLSDKTSLSTWLATDPLTLEFKVDEVASNVSGVVQSWYDASSFQFRARSVLIPSDWTPAPLPTLPSGRTILMQGTWQNDDQSIREVLIAIIADSNQVGIERLVWFAKSDSPPPLFNGDPQQGDGVTLNRVSSVPSGFTHFFDETICG